LPSCNRASSRNLPTSSPPACSRTTGQGHHSCRTLIVARKGLYTALAKWARGKGFEQLRVDGALFHLEMARLDRFVEHNIELPLATLAVKAGRETQLREILDTALNTDAASCTSASRAARESAVFSRTACPTCGRDFPNSIRVCFHSIRAMDGAALFRHGSSWPSSMQSRAAKNRNGEKPKGPPPRSAPIAAVNA